MKIIYLGAHKAIHENYNMTYQDINDKRDIGGDMMDVDLTPYDVIIATPPCNYWSRANYRREMSEYAQSTKYLLPGILLKLQNQNKPYIIENVRNSRLFKEYGLYNGKSYLYEHGRHTYWTNVPFNPSSIAQENDFIAVNKRVPGEYGMFMTPNGVKVKSAGQKVYINPNGKYVNSSGVMRVNKNVQGGNNVYQVIEYWLELVKAYQND